ncbi:ATP-binding protein [bacterium]|nr:ATP-binding protein [bacterium]
MQTKIFDQLKISAIEDNSLINRAEQRFVLYEIGGVDCYFANPNLATARRFIAKELPVGSTIEYFQYSLLSHPLLKDVAEDSNSIINIRKNFLKKSGIKHRQSYLAVSTDAPQKEDMRSSDTRLSDAVVTSSGVSFRQLESSEIKLFLYKIISGDSEMYIHPDMSVREEVIQQQCSYAPDYMKIGNRYLKTLSLKFLPDETRPFLMAEILDYLHYEYFFSLTYQLLDSVKEKASLEMRKRLQTSVATRNANIKDEAAVAKVSHISELLTLLASGDHPIGFLSSKIVLWDNNLAQLEKKTERLIAVLKRDGFFYEEETLWHDKEFFCSLPSVTGYSHRSMRVVVDNFLDLLPISAHGEGDINSFAPWLLRNRYGELFGFDAGASHRNNKNGMIFGASGSGKSVTVNAMIAHTLFPNIMREKERQGRIFIVDFAGAENSSYLKMKDLFGGVFIPISAAGDITINIFPPKKEVFYNGKWESSTLTFLNIALDLIVENRDKTMQADLYRAVISRAIRAMYQEVEQPILSDLLRYISDDDAERAQTIVNLLQAFLDDPVSSIINGYSTVDYGNEPFVIYDLQGVSNLNDKLKELMTLVVIEESKKTAFRVTNSFILFDEATQLIKDPRLVSLIDELFSTARKYNTGVWTITQNFLSFKEAALSSKVKINSTTTIFLSHANDEEAKRVVIDDFGMSKAEAEAFSSLVTVKGEYATALFQTQMGATELSEVVRIELSALDYAISTSDKEDNRLLMKLAEKKGISLHQACVLAARVATEKSLFVMRAVEGLLNG